MSARYPASLKDMAQAVEHLDLLAKHLAADPTRTNLAAFAKQQATVCQEMRALLVSLSTDLAQLGAHMRSEGPRGAWEPTRR